jgi:hypothetical protein
MTGGEEQGRRLFGVSLTDRPVWQQFLICSSGFFFGYLVNGICEVTKSPPPSVSIHRRLREHGSVLRPLRIQY